MDSGFNSTLVRLRLLKDSCLQVNITSFNSTLVRLRHKIVGSDMGYFFKFQFHSGSIKTQLKRMLGVSYKSFNSTLVRLRHADLDSIFQITEAGFQFHSGSIKTLLICFGCQSFISGFNSTLVRLRRARHSFTTLYVLVSIPLWFD